LRNGQPRIVYYDDDEGGVLQARTMQEAEEAEAVPSGRSAAASLTADSASDLPKAAPTSPDLSQFN